MTTTSGPSARHGGPVDPRPRAVDPRDAPAGPAPSASEAAGLCDQARDLAENGHLDRAAELYRGAVAADPPPDGPGPRGSPARRRARRTACGGAGR
ncbi:tetratricopeptide repeat protein, partial [Nocardiopsis changdeensis]